MICSVISSLLFFKIPLQSSGLNQRFFFLRNSLLLRRADVELSDTIWQVLLGRIISWRGKKVWSAFLVWTAPEIFILSFLWCFSLSLSLFFFFFLSLSLCLSLSLSLSFSFPLFLCQNANNMPPNKIPRVSPSEKYGQKIILSVIFYLRFPPLSSLPVSLCQSNLFMGGRGRKNVWAKEEKKEWANAKSLKEEIRKRLCVYCVQHLPQLTAVFILWFCAVSWGTCCTCVRGEEKVR